MHEARRTSGRSHGRKRPPVSASDEARPILVLSAFDPELAPLRAALRRAPLSSLSVFCLSAGIGAIDSAIGAANAIAAHRPRGVLFIGTGGTYSGKPPVGGVAIARALLLISTAVVRGDGYLPRPMHIRVAADPTLQRALAAAAAEAAAASASVASEAVAVLRADVATVVAITKSAGLAARLAKAAPDAVENLEAFAVARAAQLAGIPFAAVLGISNRVGPRAHAEWLRHQSRATAAASAVAEAYLRNTDAAATAAVGLKAPSPPKSTRHRRPTR